MPIDYYSATVGGPAEIIHNASASIWAAEDIHFAPEPVWKDVVSHVYGDVEDTLENLTIKIPVSVMPLWENLAILLPDFYRRPVVGSRLIGSAASAKTMDIWGINGDLYHLFNVAVTKPPELQLGPDANPIASAEFTAVCAPTKQLGDTDAFYNFTASAAKPAGSSNFSLANLLRCRWTGTFEKSDGLGGYTPVSGFSGFETESHFVVTPSPKITEVKSSGLTRDWKLESMRWSIKFIPIGPTLSQIETAFGLTGIKQGGRAGAAATGTGRLTLTSAVNNKSLVFNNVCLKKHSAIYGKPLRNGELLFESLPAFATGGAQLDLLTLT